MDYTNYIKIDNFHSCTDGNLVTKYYAIIYLIKNGNVGWSATDELLAELIPTVYGPESKWTAWNRGDYVPAGVYSFVKRIQVSSTSPEGLQSKIAEIVDPLKIDLQAVERRNVEYAAREKDSAEIVVALAAIDYIGKSESQISAIAAAVSASEREKTLSLVRERLSKLTYKKSALKSISDL